MNIFYHASAAVVVKQNSSDLEISLHSSKINQSIGTLQSAPIPLQTAKFTSEITM